MDVRTVDNLPPAALCREVAETVLPLQGANFP
jgi:hypothetical protein